MERQFNKYYNNININKNIKNPSRKNPSFSSILITNPDVKIGSRNAVELSVFFNSISNIEWSRAYPYFNAEFVIPTFSKQDSSAIIKAATINQFINGSIKNLNMALDESSGIRNLITKIFPDLNMPNHLLSILRPKIELQLPYLSVCQGQGYCIRKSQSDSQINFPISLAVLNFSASK